jgi:hypothetical protein
MNTKHTPAPLEITESGSNIEITGPDGESIAIILKETNQMANARLFVKAPELLELVRGYLSTADPLDVEKMVECDVHARALIAEIEGGKA